MRFGIGLLVVLGLIALGGWLAFQRIPSWYEPLDVPRAELPRVRNSLPNAYQALNDGIATGRPFTFVLDQRTVTEWVVARAELYPEAGDWLPDWLQDPVVRFRQGRCIVAARIDYEGWQTILGIHLAADVAPDGVVLRVVDVTAGALPVPLGSLVDPLDALLHHRRLDVGLMPDPVAKVVRRLQEAGAEQLIAEGFSWRNIFQTRKGRRPFKIRSLSAADGKLLIQIDPR